MVDLIKQYQTYLLIWAGSISLLLVFFSCVINLNAKKEKYSLIKLEMTSAVLLLSDGLLYIFSNDTSVPGLAVTRITGFLLFACILASIYFLNEYVLVLLMQTGKLVNPPKRLIASSWLTLIGMLLLIISQFTGMYYYFDEHNEYVRGPLFLVSYVVPLALAILMMSVIIQYRHLLSKRMRWALYFYAVFPYSAGLLQMKYFGLSLMNFAIWFAGIVLFFFALVMQNEQMIKASFYDLPTGIFNTVGFINAANKVIRDRKMSDYNGYYIDIVKMGRMNSKYGNRLVDEIILKYAHTLKDFMDKDEVVGRLGGNYFVALVKKNRTDLFLDLVKDIPVNIVFNGKEEKVHVSSIVGGYVGDEEAKNAGQIISICAAALSYAKNEVHRPYVFMDERLSDTLKRNQQMELEVRTALENGEFEPFYQPKVDSKDNTLMGAEALARWRKGDKLIPPFEFISLMEKNGSICELDFYILNCVCKDIKHWLEEKMDPVVVSVNFSRKNLGNPKLAEMICKVIEKYEIPKQYIQIEFTETIDEYPASYLINVVNSLKKNGISAAIDDFGVGSSSIALLGHVQFDVLKIDKSFVSYNNKVEKQILKDMIQMANHIGIKVIAEGVEKMDQVAELGDMGCFNIQGYVFDKPLEKSAYEERLMNRKYVLS